MRLSAERRLAAPRELVWQALNDIETLRSCIPGCETLERSARDEFRAQVNARVGPVSARFRGSLKLRDLDPPGSYTIAGEGEGGAAGFVRGEARVRLQPDGVETVLAYDVHATVGGKLAQIGSRLVDAAASKLADAFFECFAQTLSSVPADAVPVKQIKRSGLVPGIWVPLLIALVFLVLYLSSRL